jgi:hypothetical protein
MTNTDCNWQAAAAVVDDLELDRGFEAEYQGKLQTIRNLVLDVSFVLPPQTLLLLGDPDRITPVVCGLPRPGITVEQLRFKFYCLLLFVSCCARASRATERSYAL